MKRTTLMLAALTLLLGATGRASAGIMFVSSPGGLNADATFHWGTFANDTSLADPSNLTAGPLNFTLSSGAAITASSDGGFNLVNGNTTIVLQREIAADAHFRFDFATPVTGFGASEEWGGYEVANYTITAFGAGNVQLFSHTVQSDSNGDPLFLGVLSDSANITAVTLSADGPSAPHSLAMNDPIFQLSPTTTATPEPASIALLGMGAVGMVGFARRGRRQAA
jgi:hypothetical protein